MGYWWKGRYIDKDYHKYPRDPPKYTRGKNRGKMAINDKTGLAIRKRGKGGHPRKHKKPLYRGRVKVHTNWHIYPEERKGWKRRVWRRTWVQVACGMCGGKPSILPCPRCRDRRWMPKRGVAIFPPKFKEQAKIRRRAYLMDLWEHAFQRHEPGLFDKKDMGQVDTVLRIFERWLTAESRQEKKQWEAELARFGWWRKPPLKDEIDLQFDRRRMEMGLIPPKRRRKRKRFEL